MLGGPYEDRVSVEPCIIMRVSLFQSLSIKKRGGEGEEAICFLTRPMLEQCTQKVADLFLWRGMGDVRRSLYATCRATSYWTLDVSCQYWVQTLVVDSRASSLHVDGAKSRFVLDQDAGTWRE